MKKELFIHFGSTLLFLGLIILLRQWFSLASVYLVAGGLIGTFMPDIDHLIYVYFLKPHEVTSQRVINMVGKGQILHTFQLMATTRTERKQLIFHTALFQIIFIVLTFLIITSSGSMFGTGLALAFSLHLLTDQLLDLLDNKLQPYPDYISSGSVPGVNYGGLDNWFRQLEINPDRQKSVFYWTSVLIVIIIFGFLL